MIKNNIPKKQVRGWKEETMMSLFTDISYLVVIYADNVLRNASIYH